MSTFAARIARDVVRISGPDAVPYLQGQISQDLDALSVGTTAWSFILQPQGKVDAWFRITRLGGDAVVLDVEGGWGDVLVQRIERFKLRVKFEVERLDWQCVAVRGVVPDDNGGAELEIPVAWGDTVGVDLLGPSVSIPPGVAEGTAEEYTAWRISVGMPAMGAELDESTIPAEAGAVVERSVSFTKGCYTGQELVARVDSRGSNTPRKLRAVELEHPGAQPADPLTIDGRDIGVLTSVAGTRALAYVHRSVEPPATATAGATPATITAL
jgi:folate-binding protein YgfZ